MFEELKYLCTALLVIENKYYSKIERSDLKPSIIAHSVNGSVLHINLKTIYEDLKKYINNKINELYEDNAEDRVLTIKIGKRYASSYEGPLKQSLESLII